MNAGKFEQHVNEARDAAPEGAPLGGTKAEATQRLQVGLAGIGSMVLLVGLASVIGNQADRTDDAAVPDAAPTTEPTEAAPQTDPLADAGIVPDIPSEPDEPSEVADLPAPGTDNADSPVSVEGPRDLPGENDGDD